MGPKAGRKVRVKYGLIGSYQGPVCQKSSSAAPFPSRRADYREAGDEHQATDGQCTAGGASPKHMPSGRGQPWCWRLHLCSLGGLNWLPVQFLGSSKGGVSGS